MKFRNRKGSLELSVNAIVILVMAIAVLGLGLAFVRGLMKQGQEKLGGILDKADVQDPATSEIPMKLDPSVTVKKGDFGRLTGSFFNVEPTDMVFNISAICDPATNVTLTDIIDMPVPGATFQGFYTGVSVAKDAVDGNRMCTVKVVQARPDASGTVVDVPIRQAQFLLTIPK